jgi:putative phage-type endonuclease
MASDIFDLLNEQLDSINYNEDSAEVTTSRDEWHQKRLGKLTSSRYENMMQKGKGEKRFGTECMKYVYEKVAELLTNAPHVVESQAMTWGSNMEAEAIKKYEEETGNKVTPADFIEFGEFAGGTPDGLVGDDGIIEVKCPFNPANHIEYILSNKVPDKYLFQVQGNMMVTSRKWCDFISYDPRVNEDKLKIFIVRVERNEEIITAIRERITEVSELVKELYTKALLKHKLS